MDAKIIAFVACRLLALYAVVNYGLIALTHVVGGISSRTWLYALCFGGLLAVVLCLALLLWIRALAIATCMTRGLPESRFQWSALDWQVFAVICVGGLFILTGLHVCMVASLAYFRHEEGRLQNFLPKFVIRIAPYFGLGALLVWTSRPLVLWLHRLRTLGLSVQSDEDEA